MSISKLCAELGNCRLDLADARRKLREQAAELAALRERAERAELERDRLIEKWPMFVQGGDLVPNEVIDYEDGEWWYGEGKGRSGPYPTREAAVRAAAGIEPAREHERSDA